MPAFGTRKVATIDRAMVRRYFGKLTVKTEAGEMAGGTVHKNHTTLSSIMSEAVELEYIAANPARRVRGMPSPKRQRQPVYLTREQAERSSPTPTRATRR